MVGLKTFWISIFALFLLGACVPQTKQTECGSNEAFNAALRSCVPVVQGPSAFINITSFVPSSSITRYKQDGTAMTFQIVVSNPYNQTYSIEWERVFNATTTNMCTNSNTCIFTPFLLGTTLGEVGTHVLIAKIKDGNGTVVTSHNFEIRIVDLPTPIVDTPTVTPSSYAVELYPTDPAQVFRFSIKNNGAVITGNNYRTTWTVEKNGVGVPSLTEVDNFTDATTNGTNVAYFGNPVGPVIRFNPATLGVGSYIVRAVVANTNNVVAEQQWSVVVKQPDLGNILTIAQPAPGTAISAHHQVAYNTYPTYSWVYGASNTKPNFCITLDDADGTYAADGKGVQVKFYLDGTGGDICTKETMDSPGTQTICLIDANLCDNGGAGVAFDPTILKFDNTGPTVTMNHKITARVFDKATTLEYQRSNVTPSNGSYPVEWNVLTKPVNTAPVLGFGSVLPTGCTNASSIAKTNCEVTQGTPFTVSFTVTDDFYTPLTTASNANEIAWNVNLKYNNVDLVSPPTVTSCSKALATAVPAYGTQYTCTLTVPHYNAGGPLNPSTGYTVVATAEDSGSPVGGLPLISTQLTWGLKVTEGNSGTTTINTQTAMTDPSVIAKGLVPLDSTNPASFATEGETVNFQLKVNDAERDNLQYKISLCTTYTVAPDTCTTSTALTVPSYIDFLRNLQVDPIANPALISALLYTLPEDLLISKISPAQNIDTATSAYVLFKIEVSDKPSIPTTVVKSDTQIFKIYVRNYNPAPVINTAAAVPAVGTTNVVYSGFPFSIDPGSVTDASVPAAERAIQYQWFAKKSASPTWVAISNATSKVLTYTPGNDVANIDLKLCVGDGTAANVISSSGNCSGVWVITPKPFLNYLSGTDMLSVKNEVAVWYDDKQTDTTRKVIYTAYTGLNGSGFDTIFVEKSVRNLAGDIVQTTTTSFPALASTGASTVTNLSISGSANSLYIAYQGTIGGTNPIPRIRRIDKSFDSVSSPTRMKNNLVHPAPIGFSYGNYTINIAGVTGITRTYSDGVGSLASLKITSMPSGSLVLDDVTFTASASPTTENEFCSNAASCNTLVAVARQLANKINAHSTGLRGITATIDSGNTDTILLHGKQSGDYLDFDGLTASVPGTVISQAGKIMVTASRWYLPVISATPSPSQNNIVVISGPIDVHLRLNLSNLMSDRVLSEMGKVESFDNKIASNGEFIFARISAGTSPGQLHLFRYDEAAAGLVSIVAASAPAQSSYRLFGTSQFDYVRLAANITGNNNFYVIARNTADYGSGYRIGRYQSNLDTSVAPSQSLLSTKVSTTDNTATVMEDSILKVPDLVSVPNTDEARIFFRSVGFGTDPHVMVARWKGDDTVTCGTCDSLTEGDPVLSTSVIGVSQVANDMVLGNQGSVAGENVKDLVFLGLLAGPMGTEVPQQAVINIEASIIKSTTVDPAGLWRPPFVLDQ